MKKMRWIVLLAMLILLCMSLTACGFEPTPGGTVVIIAGRHANARMYTEDVLRDEVGKIIRENMTREKTEDGHYVLSADITVIVSDGKPEKVPLMIDKIVKRVEDDEIVSECINQEIELEYEMPQHQNLRGYDDDIVDDVIQFLMQDDLKANDDEVDLIAAVSEASNILRRSKKESKHLVILDTGITTSGYLDMTKEYQYDEHLRYVGELIHMGAIDDVVGDLDEGAFPDLTGVKLSFIGLGNVSLAQSDFEANETLKTNMEDLWKNYFGKCGVSSVYTNEIYFYESFGQSMDCDKDVKDGGYPHVSVVPFSIRIYDPPEPPTVDVPQEETVQQETPIMFNALELQFKQNSSEFVNPATALAKIDAYREDLIRLAKLNVKIYVVGCIAQEQKNQKYEKTITGGGRAKTVSQLLIDNYGFKPENIVVIDAGILPVLWRLGDEFHDGRDIPDEEEMKKNRIVCIFSENLEEYVQSLVDNGLIDKVQ